jgi:hypothetical protein
MINTGESGDVPGIRSLIKAKIIHNLLLGKNQGKSLGDSICYKIGVLVAARLSSEGTFVPSKARDKPLLRVPKYILKPPDGGTLIVKERFGCSVNLYKCLVQTR